MPVALYNSELAKKTAVDPTDFATEIYYYEEGQKIQLKNSLGDVISEIDASRFVVDGMIEGVEIVDDNLVIHFNTDAGKEDIVIPISDIFDADNYYTKSATDDAISDAIDALNLGDAAYRNATDDIVVDHDAYFSQDLVSTRALLNFMLDEGYVDTEEVISLVREMTSNQPVTISRYEGDSNPISFTLNQRSVYNGNLGLADGAFKAVDTSIDAQSDANIPTSGAVKNYILGQGFAPAGSIGNGKVTIKKNSAEQNPFNFTLNQATAATLDLGLGSASAKDVDSSIVAQSDANLPTSGAVKSYVTGQGYITAASLPTVNNSSVTIARNASDQSPISFTLNQAGNVNGNLGLADGAFKAVDTSIGSSSSSNLPTSDAVKGYIQNQNFATVSQIPTVNNATVSIARNASDQNPCTFTMNQSAPASFDLGLADGAFKAVDTAISSQSSSNVPTSDAVKSYVQGQGYATVSQIPQVGNGTITIKKNAGDTTNPFNFSMNQTASDELNLGLGAAAEKNVDTAITQNSSSNLPTSDAVKGYAYSKAEIDSSYIVSAVYDAATNALTLVRGDGTTQVIQF